MTPQMIMELVAARAGVTSRDLTARKQERRCVHARQVAAWLMRERLGMSYPAIADVLQRDHTTALYAVRKVATALTAAAQGRDTSLAALAVACMHISDAQEPEWRAYLDVCRRRNQLSRISGGWKAYLAAQRRRYADMQARWRREALERIWQARARRRVSTLHRHIPRARISGMALVIVPRGRTITQTIMGDPPPERSALTLKARNPMQEQRFNREAFLNSLRISNERRNG